MIKILADYNFIHPADPPDGTRWNQSIWSRILEETTQSVLEKMCHLCR